MLNNNSITVVLTTFNSSSYVDKSIESILNQSINVNTIIIVDDNSDDFQSLKEIVNNFIIKNNIDIKLISNKEIMGPGHNRNLAWSLCNTEFIAFCDDDDIWHKDKLKYQFNIIKKKKTIMLVASKKKFFSENLNMIVYKSLSLKTIKLSFIKLLFTNSIATSSVILRSDLKDRFLNEFYAEDYYLWLSILKKKYECYLINEYLCSEIYTNKKTKLSRDNLNMQRGVQNVLNKFYNKSLVNNMLVNFAKFFHFFKYYLKNKVKSSY